MRIAISCSYRNADAAAAAEMTKIAEELCYGMALRCIKVVHLPYARSRYQPKAEGVTCIYI